MGMAFSVRDGVRVAALVILPPVGAASIVALLLLLGVTPHLVFLPGFAAMSGLHALGVSSVANRVGVLTTVGLWWVIIMVVVLALKRRQRRKGSHKEKGEE